MPVEISVSLEDVASFGLSQRRHDFHCVTTWTHQGVTWGGAPMDEVWQRLIAPRVGTDADAPFVVARGADGFRAVFQRDDLLDPAVMLAWMLDGAPLDAVHGAPLRLVCPQQYGYKSVKHLYVLELHRQQPRLGAKEHLRARVAHEERHSRLPNWLVRVPYRSLVRVTALLAERSAAAGPAGSGFARPAPREEPIAERGE